MKIKLVKTCGACPEQYDAFDEKGNQVGYLRLRHGYFSVSFPDVGGETIYEAYPQGDGLFEYEERDRYLSLAVNAIKLRLETPEEKDYYIVDES